MMMNIIRSVVKMVSFTIRKLRVVVMRNSNTFLVCFFFLCIRITWFLNIKTIRCSLVIMPGFTESFADYGGSGYAGYRLIGNYQFVTFLLNIPSLVDNCM